ncbi:hypothetical protein M096_4976 [Parabacteroides distasonis str. 3999B T(B) 6]|nr:hypothetical protein M095_3937 [Parabacteroides distasonis str. 3999B T(B) 4]KDS65097.1 hypothetical protein M096_4976 [Parabacteroides distasonis str. 3999B T(B) 6]
MDGRNPVCLNFSFGVLFWQSSPKKSPKNAFLTIGYDIVKYAKT